MGNWFEELSLSWGFGWVMSKFIPYVCMILLAVCLFLLIRKRIHRRSIKLIVLILLLLVPSGIYFAFNPIYAADLAHNSIVYKSDEPVDKNEKIIFVYTIPGCPFCIESVAMMDAFQKRNPHVRVVYVVVDGMPKDVAAYQRLSKHGIRFITVNEEALQERKELIQERYPTFMIARSGETEVWTNNDIGAVVLDDWEEEFKKK